MVEDMEIKLRLTLEQIYFGKTKDILNELRSFVNASLVANQRQISKQIGANLGAKK